MIKQAIDRLLSEQDVNQLADNVIVKATRGRYPELAASPFLECQLVLKGGYSMAGVLTAFPAGPLLLVAIAKTPENKVVLAEHYFGDGEIQAIVVGRDMPEQHVQSNRRPLIFPGG